MFRNGQSSYLTRGPNIPRGQSDVRCSLMNYNRPLIQTKAERSGTTLGVPWWIIHGGRRTCFPWYAAGGGGCESADACQNCSTITQWNCQEAPAKYRDRQLRHWFGFLGSRQSYAIFIKGDSSDPFNLQGTSSSSVTVLWLQNKTLYLGYIIQRSFLRVSRYRFWILRQESWTRFQAESCSLSDLDQFSLLRAFSTSIEGFVNFPITVLNLSVISSYVNNNDAEAVTFVSSFSVCNLWSSPSKKDRIESRRFWTLSFHYYIK